MNLTAPELIEPRGSRQQELMQALLRHKQGLSIDVLASQLSISRNAIRQHLTSLERDGLIQKGNVVPSGGRPEQLYVLSTKAIEQFPKQYSWLAELLLQEIATETNSKGLSAKLAAMGKKIGASLKQKLPGADVSSERINALAQAMANLGYDATSHIENGEHFIKAQNCVFHSLAEKIPEVCSFDLALLATGSGGKVEHRECMVRGGTCCQFQFKRK